MPKCVLTVGLGFGDEGKGTTVDYLTRESQAHTVIRYCGGAQAAHNVVLPNGKHHTFAQFGSGTLAGARTHLSRFMLVNPSTLWNESHPLRNLGVSEPYELLTIERGALLTAPPHIYANHIRERQRGNGRHGSCGLGIGETMAYSLKYPGDAPRIGDLENPSVLKEKVDLLSKRLGTELGVAMDRWDEDSKALFYGRCEALTSHQCLVGEDYLPELMRKHDTIFEGAQGVLLDENFGFHPYTTWSTTTLANAHQLLVDYEGDVTRMGILRSYTTRHGPGPFPSYNPDFDIVTEPHNGFGEWQREFRRGYLDLVLTRYALDVIGGVDEIALTHLDWTFKNELNYAVVDYEGIDYANSEVFWWNDFSCSTRIHVRSYDTMEEQLAWQSKITQALEGIDLKRLNIQRHFRMRDPASAIENALMGADVWAPVTLMSHGPTYLQKQRVSR